MSTPKNLSVKATSPEDAKRLVFAHPNEVMDLIDSVTRHSQNEMRIDRDGILSDIFIYLLETGIPNYNPEYKVTLSTYISCIAIRRYKNAIKQVYKTKNNVKKLFESKVNDKYVERPDISIDIFEHLLKQPTKTKVINKMYWIDGLEVKEICTKLGWSDTKVYEEINGFKESLKRVLV